MTHVEARLIGQRFGMAYVETETVDGKVAVHNALFEVAMAFEPKIEAKIIGAFQDILWQASYNARLEQVESA